MAKKTITLRKASKKEQKEGLLKGKPLHHAFAVEKRVREMAEAMVATMTSVCEREITALFRKQKDYFAQDASIASQARIVLNSLGMRFTELFNTRGKALAKYMARRANAHSKAVVGESLKEIMRAGDVNMKELSAETKEMLKASVSQAADYFQSLQQDYMTKIKGAVYRSITSGNGLKDLTPFFAKIKGVTMRRAKLIALDQTRKVTSALNQARMVQNGVSKFIWNHSGGGLHPRTSHLEFDGNVYSFDDLPYDSDVGRRVYPAELPNCRCFATPVIELQGGNV